MKTLLGTLLIAILSTNCIAQNTNNQTHNHSEKMNEKEVVTKKKVLSPHTETMAMIGDAHIHIDYSSPGVRGRIIFGGLVGYNTIWQAGAHKATWIETNKDLIIDGKTLPAGKYGFFTIPSNDEWTIMINKNWDQHGKDEYDEKEDVIRFNVKSILSETTIEHLEYKVKKISDTEGSISLAWEKVLIDFNFTVKQ
jgi:hypothetical protein